MTDGCIINGSVANYSQSPDYISVLRSISEYLNVSMVRFQERTYDFGILTASTYRASKVSVNATDSCYY